MSLLTWKTVHLLAVVAFLGNIVTGLFWKALADRRGDLQGRLLAIEGIIVSDRLFTLPGVALIVASGIAMAVQAGIPLLGTPWLGSSIALFTASGLVFGTLVAPAQRTMRLQLRLAVAGRGWDEAAHRRVSRRWEVFGLLALLLPLVVVGLMVHKPATWGWWLG
jgi:uncharacterized membrane protein